MDGSGRRPVGYLERARRVALPGGVVLKDYQATGVARLLSSTAPIHAWAIGSGKTLLAIVAFVLMREDRPGMRMVVTMPKSILTQWRDQLELFGFKVYIMRSPKPLPPDVDVILAPATVALVNRRGLLASWLRDGFLVLDEAHLFKSATAKRTQAVYGTRLDRKGGLAEKARHVLAMSGTFAPNHNGELYPHLRALAPETLGGGAGGLLSKSEFENRYCVMRPFGPSRTLRPASSLNTGELRERINPRVTVVTPEQVQAAFPHPRSEVVRINPQDVDFDFLAAAALIPDPELRERAASAHRKILLGSSDAIVDAAVAELLALAGQDHHLSHLRRAIGVAKIAWLVDLLEGRAFDRPTLVFNSYTQTGGTAEARLEAQGIRVARIYGATSDKEREAAIAAVRAGATDVGLLQIDTAGAGLNFQAADTVVMLEPSWSTGVNEQAIGRACRLGQDTSVRILWPVIRGTIDEAVLRVLRRKSANTKILWA